MTRQRASRTHVYLSSNFWNGLWIIQQPTANEIARQEPGEVTSDIMAQVAAETGRMGLDEDMLTFGVGLALLTGLVSDLAVAAAANGIGTEVRMSWPVGRRPGH